MARGTASICPCRNATDLIPKSHGEGARSLPLSRGAKGAFLLGTDLFPAAAAPSGPALHCKL